MKKLLIVLLLGATLSAQQFTYTAQEQITVANSAIGFTAACINTGAGASACGNAGTSHAQANVAACANETAEIRVTVDGTTPTTTVGTVVAAGQSFQVVGNNALNLFRAIRTGSSSGILTCNYSAP